jgi:single-strand DNA-binding protein
MSDTNIFVLTGRLTKDVELVELNGGTSIAKSSVASNRVRGSGDERKEETLFMDFNIFGNQAKYFADNTGKGKRVLLRGRIKTDKWDDKKGGGTREKTVLNVDDFELLDRTPKQPSSEDAGTQKSTGKTTKGTKKVENEEEIPF